MNKATTLCIGLFFCFCFTSKASDNTITHYDPHCEQVYYNDPNITAYAARFDLIPCTVEKITVRLSGGVAAQAATVRIYGHEGGGITPQFRKELVPSFTIEKKEVGLQAITVALPTPLRIANNQIFVVVENLSENIQLVSDSKIKEPSCYSANGEPSMVQFLRGRDEKWRYGLFAFGIDLLVIPNADSTAPRNLVDVTTAAGINDSLHFRSIAWNDVDQNGWQDVLVGGRLYVNADGVFRDETTVHNLTYLSDFSFFVDSEKDGYNDIVVLQSQADSALKNNVLLYQNRGGKFASVQVLSITASAPTCFAITDINRDSYPDIFIGQGEDSSGVLQPDIFLINDTKGGYIQHPVMYQEKHSITTGAMWVDFNNDDLPDLYLVKRNGQYDELWRNNSDGTFTNVIDNSFGRYNTNRLGYKIGCDWADYDNDGDMDILQPQQVSPLIYNQYKQSGSAILRNAGAPDYKFHTLDGTASGLELEEMHAGGSFGDINNDGLLDVFLTTSCPCRYADLYTQNREHDFEMESFKYGVHTMTAGVDAVWVDFNNDGKLDIATGVDGKFALLVNAGTYNSNFVQIDLQDMDNNAQAVGARVVVYSRNDQYSSSVVSGRGYAMQSSPRLHFGIDQNTSVDSVAVHWPDGHTEVFDNIEINKNNVLREKTGGATGENIAGITVRAYPNPFAIETVFEYEVVEAGRVHLEIYTLLGEHIITLVDTPQQSGTYKIKWNGRDKLQKKIATGTHLYKLTAGGKVYTGHITIEG